MRRASVVAGLLAFCAVIAALPPKARAEEAPPVSAVRLDGPPAARLERLRRFLEEIPAGQPLSAERVRHVAELLFATGRFEDVRVETRPSAGGVEVVFQVVPAPLFQGLEVEGDRVLTRARVRAIARFREREPLWPERLDGAARELALELGRRGWLEAQVTSRLRRGARGATAIFRIQSGPRARVEAARVSGDAGGQTAALAALVHPLEHQPFRRAAAEAARSQMESSLREMGRGRATVTLQDAYDPQDAGVVLTYAIEAGPRTAVEFTGDRLPQGLRRTLLKLMQEGGMAVDVLDETADRIEAALIARGHRTPVVRRSEEDRGAVHAFVYDVEAGPRATVASVRVLGDAVEGWERLLQVRAGEDLQEARLSADAQLLRTALQERGHADAQVEAEVAEGGGFLPVVYRVRAGVATAVSQVSVEPGPPAEVSVTEMHVRPGGPYRVRDVALDRNDLQSAWRNGGYPQAEVTPEIAFSEDRRSARVAFRVTPGQKVSVAHVVVAGLDRTRERVVVRELAVSEGEPLGAQRVLETQRRLGALGLFRSVSVSEVDPESVGTRSLVVAVEEGPRTFVSYGIGYAERDRLRGSAEVTRKNLFGLDRTLSLFGRLSFKGSRILASLREPWLLGRRQELFLTAYREQEDREAFDFRRWGGVVQTARSLGARWSLIGRYTFQETTSFNIVDPDELDREFANSTLSGPSVSVVDDTRDDALDPHRGRFMSADVLLSATQLGGDSFVRGFLQAAGYRRVAPRVTLAIGARLGLSRTFGYSEPLLLPRPDRFYAGGDYSLRGFPVDGVDPRGGNALLLGNAEARIDLGKRFSGALFADSGAVYPLVTDMSLDLLRYTAGGGVRYRSSIGPLRADVGYKLNRRPGESAYRIHFTVGHAF